MSRLWIAPNRVLLVTGMMLVLSACGFQLRGHHTFAKELSVLDIVGPDSEIDVIRYLRRSLGASGVTAKRSEKPGDAFYLELHGAETEQRTASFSSVVETAELEISSTLKFTLFAPDGTVIIGPRPVTTERVYLHDRDQLLGDDAERDLLMQDMREEVANRILLQLRTLTSEQIQQRIAESSATAES